MTAGMSRQEALMILTTAAALIITLVIGVLCWPYIREMFVEHIIPFVKVQLGETVGERVADLICWIDSPASVLRGKLKGAYRLFQQRVLGINTTYTKVASNRLNAKTETYLIDRNGRPVKQVIEKEVAWEDLPPQIRQQMIERGTKTAEMDVKDIVEHQVREAALKQKLELSYLC